LDFWIEPRIGEVAIRVGPEDYNSFTEVLEKRGIKYEKINDNIQEQIDEQWEEIGDKDINGEGSADAFTLNQYNTLADIHAWVRAFPTRYPNSGIRFTIFEVGRSYQNNPLLAIRLSAGSTGTKKVAFFNGGIHAREWISPATVCYMLYSIAENYTAGVTQVVNILNNIDIVVLPVLNPDGYLYTWSNDRLWRKTRSPNSGSTCVGTDPNRNWADHWGYVGSSTNPCSETYMGPSQASEIEVRSIQSYLSSANNNVYGYMDYHAYSQLMLYPWGWSNNAAPGGALLGRVGREYATLLRSWFGTTYTVGPIYSTIYPASGSSADYALGQAQIPLAYAPELRPTSSSSYGFQLPANQIIASGLETFEGHLKFLEEVRDYAGTKKVVDQ